MDTKSTHKRHYDILTSLISGATAGAIAKTVIAPLDRTKINFQVSNRRYSFIGAVRFVINSYKNDGILSLWRGNSATMARVIPFAAFQFCAHEEWKRSTPYRRILAGSLAGCTATCLTYPLDLAKARLAVFSKCEYKTLCSVFSKIVKSDGYLALYRGLKPTLLGSIPYSGASFFTYETLKYVFLEDRRKQDPGARLSKLDRFLFGALAGLIGQSSSYPLDICRRRMQVDTLASQKSIIGLLIHIARTEGIMHGWYKGLSMNWVKGPIAVGISFTVFDSVLHFLRDLPFFSG